MQGEPRASVPARFGGVISRLGRSLRARQVWWLAPIAIWDPVTRCIYTSRGLRKKKALDEAEALVENARSAHPGHAGLAIEYAKIAAARRDWPNAAARWQAVLDLVKAFGISAPAEACKGLSRAYRRQGKFAAAEAAIGEGRRLHPADINVAAECAELAMARMDWPEAVRRWQTVMDDFPGRITADMYLRISLAHRLHGDFAAARYTLEMLRSTEQSSFSAGTGQSRKS